VQRAAVGKQDLDASGLSTDAISGEQRHVGRRVVGTAIPLEDG
jgi:hypothetical protein